MLTQFPTWYTFPLLHDIHLHVCHYAKFLAFLPPNRPNGLSGVRGRVIRARPLRITALWRGQKLVTLNQNNQPVDTC